MTSISCTLQTLRDTRLLGVVPGAKLTTTNELVLNAEEFPCCKGVGQRFLDDGDVCQCTLSKHRLLAEHVLALFGKFWPKRPFDLSLTSAQWNSVVKSFESKRSMKSVVTPTDKGVPSWYWAAALAVSWRFGVPVLVLDFQKVTQDAVDRFAQLLRRDSKEACRVLIIEKVAGLWKPDLQSRLEEVLSLAYLNQIIVWMEVVEVENRNENKVDNPFAFSRRISNKVKSLKERSVGSWYSDHLRSRMIEMGME